MISETDKAASFPFASASATRVLCLGNELLGDDSFGYAVAEELRRIGSPRWEVISTSESGLHLLDYVLGAVCLIVVDTIQTNNAPVGTIHEFHHGELSRFPGSTPHAMGLFEILELATRLQAAPRKVVVFALEAAECTTLGEGMSAEARAAVPVVVKFVQSALANQH